MSFRTFLLASATILMLTGSASAGTQQDKMKTCNADASAKNLKGAERQAFMKTCLSAKAPQTQQDKMKTCNADASAKGLKGDERKKFMSTCLSNK